MPLKTHVCDCAIDADCSLKNHSLPIVLHQTMLPIDQLRIFLLQAC